MPLRRHALTTLVRRCPAYLRMIVRLAMYDFEIPADMTREEYLEALLDDALDNADRLCDAVEYEIAMR
jgi:hypothetical protein